MSLEHTKKGPEVVGGVRFQPDSSERDPLGNSAHRVGGTAFKVLNRSTSPGGVAFTPSPQHQPGGVRYELRADPDTEGEVYTLRPAPNNVHLGTSTRASFREKAVSQENQETMRSDFSTIKEMLREIPDYQEMEYLNIDIDHGIFTMHMRDGTEISKGRPEIKQALRDALSANPDNSSEFIEAEIEKIDSAILRFRSICGKEGLSNIWPYNIRGHHSRGNFIGGKSLHSSHPIVQAKQCDSLKHGKDQIHSLLNQIQGRDPADTATKRHAAAKKALRGEAFLIRMRKNLTTKIHQLEQAIPRAATPQEKKKLEHEQASLIRLQDQLRKDTMRYALYCASIFDDPEVCYKAICKNMYEAAYAKMTTGKPSFEEFMASTDSTPLREYAADAASSLIADPTKYQLFCKDHDIPPKQDHINVFLMQAMRGEEINYNAVSIGFTEDEKRDLQEIIEDTNDQVDRELDARLRTVDSGSTLSPEKRLEAALDNTGWEPLFQDSEVDHSMWTNPQTGWQKAVAYPLYPVTAAGQGIKAVWKKIRGS